ncbi:MAG: Csu type fimbrial protein [Methyloligella sp. ZOD6]
MKRLGYSVLLAILLLLSQHAPAAAQSCSFSISSMSFGNVDTLGGGPVDTTATVSYSCSGLVGSYRICPSIGEGSGGADGTARYLQGPGASTLAYQLYTDAARTTVWGSDYWAYGGTIPPIDFSIPFLGGTANGTRTIYGRIFGGQGTAPEGSYSSNFTAGDDFFDYGLNVVGLIACDNIGLLTQQANPTFTATAEVQKNCTVSAQDIQFGTTGFLTANIDAQGQITATCTADTPFTIGLNNGTTGTGPTAREMSSGGNVVTYGIYKDAGHSDPWGNAGAELQGSTGTGTAQQFVTYGRVPPQTTPPPATYTDSVIVTLTY